MDRRQFLRLAATAIAAGTVLDPERLLWVPGAKTIFIPDPTLVQASTLEEAIRAGLFARVPSGNGDGGWFDMELILTGRQGHKSFEERVRAEIASIHRMGGTVHERRTYKKVELT